MALNYCPIAYFLDNEHIIAGSENVKKISPSVFNVSDPEYRKNYSLSMWIYLNDQPTNYNGYAKETNIFNYADGAPKITYQYEDKEDEEENEKINVYFTNNNELSSNLNLKMSVRVKKQKWNHIVVNYNNNFADLFVNGRLENSVSLASHNTSVFTVRYHQDRCGEWIRWCLGKYNLLFQCYDKNADSQRIYFIAQ